MNVPFVGVVLCGFVAACATASERRSVYALDRVDTSLLEASAPAALKTANFSSIEAFERFALDRNPDVRAAYLEWKAAVVEIPSARQWPAPLLKYAGLPLPVETRVGPQRHRVGVSQAIPWPGKMEAKANVLASRATLAARRFETRRVSVLRTLRGPLIRLASIAAQRSVVAEQIVLLQQLSTAVQARLAIGKASLAQATQVSLQIAKLEDRIARLDAMRPPLQAQLRSVAGLTTASKLPAIGPLPIIKRMSLPLERLRQRIADHPEARIQAAASEVQRALVRRHDAQRYPDFTLGVDWMVVDAGDRTGADAGRDALMAMVGVRVPLSLGAFEAKERAAELRAKAADARRDAVVARGDATLTMLMTRLAEAARRQELYDKTMGPQTRVALEASLASYSAARGDFRDLMELSQQLLAYRLEVILAQTDHALARVGLDYLVGSEATASPGGRP